MKVSRNGVHYDNKKEWRNRGTLANTDGEWKLLRCGCRGAHMTRRARVRTYSISSSGASFCRKAYHIASRGTQFMLS